MTEPELFYILNGERTQGLNRLMWWRPNSAGYTANLADAGRYTEAEYRSVIGDDDVPIRCDSLAGGGRVLLDAEEFVSIVQGQAVSIGVQTHSDSPIQIRLRDIGFKVMREIIDEAELREAAAETVNRAASQISYGPLLRAGRYPRFGTVVERRELTAESGTGVLFEILDPSQAPQFTDDVTAHADAIQKMLTSGHLFVMPILQRYPGAVTWVLASECYPYPVHEHDQADEGRN